MKLSLASLGYRIDLQAAAAKAEEQINMHQHGVPPTTSAPPRVACAAIRSTHLRLVQTLMILPLPLPKQYLPVQASLPQQLPLGTVEPRAHNHRQRTAACGSRSAEAHVAVVGAWRARLRHLCPPIQRAAGVFVWTVACALH
jgi:hypothetical protein